MARRREDTAENPAHSPTPAATVARIDTAGGADATIAHSPTEVVAAGRDATRAEAAVPAPGERIGHFVVTGVLGRGGMGVVVSARDPQLDREVAIKLVAPARASRGGGELRRRLLREARAMARLRHPNVISVYEVGEHAGQVYVAMEKIDGETLRGAARRLGRGSRPDWRELVRLFGEAGRGLAAAHAAGLVHRDFKPENVLIDRDGRVFVGDFGIVHETRAAAAGGSRALGDVMTTLTRTNEVVGTPAYMSPEQYRGAVDARTDQFAFCVALYEALYGERPFAGQTFREYVDAVDRGEVRPPRLDRRVPAWLRAVLLRGLAVEPSDRYASMDELLIELGVGADSARHPGRRQRRFYVVGVGLALIGWSAILFGLNIEVTYPILFGTGLGFIAVSLVFGWRSPETSFNQQLCWMGLVTGVSFLMTVAGGYLLGESALRVGALQLLAGAIDGLAATALLDRRFAVLAAAPFAAFLVAAARPALFVPATLFLNVVFASSLLVILRPRGERTPATAARSLCARRVSC